MLKPCNDYKVNFITLRLTGARLLCRTRGHAADKPYIYWHDTLPIRVIVFWYLLKKGFYFRKLTGNVYEVTADVSDHTVQPNGAAKLLRIVRRLGRNVVVYTKFHNQSVRK